MNGGINVRNNTGIEVLVTLSQIGPLHWKIIPPRTTETIPCGQVWFTVDARLIDNNGEPSKWAVAAPFVIGIGAGIVMFATGGAAIAALPEVAAAQLAAGGIVSAFYAATTEAAVCSAGFVGASAGFVGSALTGATALSADRYLYESKLKVIKEENVKKWLSMTPSKVSAEWLADKNVIAVVPKSVSGVYANGKTIDIGYNLKTSEGGSRMELDITGV